MVSPQSLILVGTGVVASSMGRIFTERWPDIHIQVLGRSLASAEKCLTLIGSGSAVIEYKELEPAELLLIAVSDDSLKACIQDLVSSQQLGSYPIVFHLSGGWSSLVLEEIKNQGSKTASLHPMRSFPKVINGLKEFLSTPCTLEGEPSAVKRIKELFEACGANIIEISPESKVSYHTAAVFSSNYLVALLDISFELLKESGLGSEREILRQIVIETVNNVFDRSPEAALTGPIARGDLSLLKEHLRFLKGSGDSKLQLYKMLGEWSIDIALRADAIDSKQAKQLKTCLKGPTSN